MPFWCCAQCNLAKSGGVACSIFDDSVTLIYTFIVMIMMTIIIIIIIITRGQSNLTKSASRGGGNSAVRGHPRGSKFVPLNSWGRVSY